jgi:hypothetical protein
VSSTGSVNHSKSFQLPDFDADNAERYGWVNRTLDDDNLDSFVDTLVRRLASFDRETLAAAKAQDVTVGVVPEGNQLQRDQQAITVFHNIVSDGCFETMGIPCSMAFSPLGHPSVLPFFSASIAVEYDSPWPAAGAEVSNGADTGRKQLGAPSSRLDVSSACVFIFRNFASGLWQWVFRLHLEST